MRSVKMPGTCQCLRLPSVITSKGSPTVSRPPEHRRRVVVMGGTRVGKSCVISRFLYDAFCTRYRCTVEELHSGKFELPDGACLTLDILDTSGAHQFPAMRRLSIGNAGAFVLVYAVDDAISWQDVERLRNEIIELRGFKVPIVIVGNKTDLPQEMRAIQREVAETISKTDWRCGYIECSAKDNENIIEIFKEILIQANINYNLSPAVRRRRQSLPNYTSTPAQSNAKYILKRHSCTVS